jgi:hypothetical protein
LSEQAPSLSEKSCTAARTFGVLGNSAFPQRTDEHLLCKLSLKLELGIELLHCAELDAKSFGSPMTVNYRPRGASPDCAIRARCVDMLVTNGGHTAKRSIQQDTQRIFFTAGKHTRYRIAETSAVSDTGELTERCVRVSEVMLGAACNRERERRVLHVTT